jgi:hypothetical protein
MRRLHRVLRSLRHGPPFRRAQAVTGIALVEVAVIWALVSLLWKLALFAALLIAGLVLLGRSSREPRPSP